MTAEKSCMTCNESHCCAGEKPRRSGEESLERQFLDERLSTGASICDH